MPKETVICISQFVKWADINDILIKKRFEYVPAISFITQKNGPNKIGKPELIVFPKPFWLWEQGLPIEILCKYAKDEIGSKEELKVASIAYFKLKNYATRCAERVIADLICSVFIKTWVNPTENYIYFIEGPPSDKVIARISYLYPSLEKLTICFISFKPEDLITSVMSFQTGKLVFDIQRLLSEEMTGLQGPYPGTSEDSLVQTYFYKHPEIRGGVKVSPLRIDVFAQGILETEFEIKETIIKQILEDDEWVTPHPIDEQPHETIIPKGLKTVIESWKTYDKKLTEKIRNYL